MKILYRQNGTTGDRLAVLSHNIKNCYLKKLVYNNDYKITTGKSHWHSEYEIHIVFSGCQFYEIDSKIYEVHKNEFIIIPPKVKHKITFTSENLIKYSLTFNSEDMPFDSLYFGKADKNMVNNIVFISEEFKQKSAYANLIIENRIFELFITLFRIVGYKEVNADTKDTSGDDRLDLAKKFISDNIERNLSVSVVASYCHMSERQLSRIFLEKEGISPAKYINREKMEKIGKYIKSSELSLQQLSEMFSYNNQYYFNTAFKNYFGMPPNEYRKMFK